MNDEELLRHHRHILLDGFDLDGQARIAAASILLVGAGGLGCPAALYLAGAGIGRLTLVDPDTVDASNLPRQVAYREADVGRSKVEALQDRVGAANTAVTTAIHAGAADADWLAEAVPRHDLVIDATDNFPTRHAINAACVQHGVPLVSGAAIRWEGQVSVFDARNEASPCYACLYPDASDEGLACAEAGVFAPLCGTVGSLMAGEALKVLLEAPGVLCGRLLVIDQRNLELRTLKLPRDPGCPICGQPG